MHTHTQHPNSNTCTLVNHKAWRLSSKQFQGQSQAWDYLMFLNRRKTFQCFHKNLIIVKGYQHQSENVDLYTLSWIFVFLTSEFQTADSNKCEATITDDSNIEWNEVCPSFYYFSFNTYISLFFQLCTHKPQYLSAAQYISFSRQFMYDTETCITQKHADTAQWFIFAKRYLVKKYKHLLVVKSSASELDYRWTHAIFC